MTLAISRVKTKSAARYELLRQLGQGRLTRVYLAALRNEGEGPGLLVLELMRKELAKHDGIRAIFLDDAAGTLPIEHPNIVRTHDVIADAEACGLSMEFLDGQPLNRVLERIGRRSFPLDLHLHILCEVLEALHYVHGFTSPGCLAGGIVHRDVSPHNVFVTYDGQIKLLRTGFAEATIALERELGRELTDVGYAAPELLLGYPAGPSADLFGVGVMLWEALACARRACGETMTAVFHQRTRGEEPDIEQVCSEAPLRLVEICGRALAVTPRDRYATALELKSDLEAYLVSAGTSDVGLRGLPSLMRSHFGQDLAEMQLFIDSSVGDVERFVPASPGVATRSGPFVVSSEGDWNDETRVVAPKAEPRGPSARLEAEPEAPARDSDTGGHRAFSANLSAVTLRPKPQRTRLLLPAAAALGVMLTMASIIRWLGQGPPERPASPDVVLGRDVQHTTTSLAAPRFVAAAATAPVDPSEQRPKEDESVDAPAIEPSRMTDPGAVAGVGASDDDAAQPVLPAAFLGVSIDAEPDENERGLEPGVAFLPSDLPRVDDARERLQEAIVVATRANQRAAASRRARAKRPKPAAPSGTVPRRIDEVDPYASAANR